MSDSEKPGGKFVELIVFPSITTAVGIGTAAYMERLNGSVTAVLSFFMSNPSAVATWTFTSLLVGVTIGAFVTIGIKSRDVKKLEQRYEAELAALRKPEEARAPSGRLNVNLAAIRCTDHGIIAAAVAAFDDERHIIPLGKYEKAVRKSINNRDGMFVLSKTAFCGMPGDEDGRFYLTQTWFKGMDDHEIIDAMRSIAEKWEAAH